MRPTSNISDNISLPNTRGVTRPIRPICMAYPLQKSRVHTSQPALSMRLARTLSDSRWKYKIREGPWPNRTGKSRCSVWKSTGSVSRTASRTRCLRIKIISCELCYELRYGLLVLRYGLLVLRYGLLALRYELLALRSYLRYEPL